MKNKFLQGFLAMGLLVLTISSAQAKTKLGDVVDKVTITGEVRVRPEFRKDLSQTVPAVPGAREEDLSVLLRSRFGVFFDPTDHLRFFLQAQDSRDFGEEAAAIPNALGDDEGLDLHQGYIEYYNIADSNFSLRAGRQEINLGEQRLVGAVGWSNVGRSFDGLVLNYDHDTFKFDALATMQNKTAAGDQTWFGGIYGTWKNFPAGVLDLYYLGLQDNDGAAGAPAGTGDTLSTHTIGARISSQPGRFDIGLEGAVQLGKFGSNSILAYAGHGAIGYTFEDTYKPKLLLEYNYATGDDGGNNRYTKFNNLFPTNHKFYGYMDLAAWSNLHNGRAEFSVKPSEKVKLALDYHIFLVDKTGAGDTFAGIAGAANVGRLAGHEGDLTISYTWNEYASFLLGYSHFVPGSFLKDQGITKHADFGYVQALASF